MSEIHITRTHGMTHKRARAAVQHIAEELAEEFGLDWAWDGDNLRFERMGVHGQLSVHKKTVDITARLGFLLAVLRPKIESEIERFCDENFGPEKT